MIMEGYIGTPVSFVREDDVLMLERNIFELISRLDNFLELIVFTRKGSFPSDPDFGFEYWNYEYSNAHYRSNPKGCNIGFADVKLKEDCQESIRASLEAYEPMLTGVTVGVELVNITDGSALASCSSKYQVCVTVSGTIEDGLGTRCDYYKQIRFDMEPTVRKVS